jgi:6-phosphogluconolactonase
MMIRRLSAISLAVLLLATLRGAFSQGSQKPSSKGEYLVYFGTYTRQSKGIYVSRFDAATGKVTPPALAAETANPTFLTIHPSRRFLYAVNETGNFRGQQSGSVSAFAIDRNTGKLTLLNQVASRGTSPAHLTVDRTGKNVLVANYLSGSVAVLPVKEDGSLAEASTFIQHTGSGPNASRQQGPHAHSVNMSPDNRFAIVADLGVDKVFVYRFDPVKGSLAANDPPYAKAAPGAGPRHFTFDPKGVFVYVLNELASTVTEFGYDASRGVLKELQTITTLPRDFTGTNTTAEVQVHPSGKFLYGSNRGHDSIAVFSIDERRGTLTPVERVSTQGKTPRNFAIDPAGAFLLAANQDTDNVVVFRIDPKTGRLTPTGQVLEVGTPVCVKFLPLP